MHADERNRALSERLGRDVYHYHLHVVYVPVVDKEIYFKKNNKNPELAGKLREVIKQVSHSKKWPKLKQPDEHGEVRRNAKGKAILVNAYSLLQDHFYEHMREAGFLGFERGERGSTAEHLSVLEYKTQKEAERAATLAAAAEEKQKAAAALDTAIEDKEQAAAELDEKTVKKRKQLDALEKKTAAAKKEAATIGEIAGMVKPALFGGNLQISPADWKKVSGLAKEGVKSRGIIAELKAKVNSLLSQINGLKERLAELGGERSITEDVKYFQARQRAPRRLAEAVAEIMRRPPEQQEHERPAPERKRDRGLDI
jgi:hypothetical protein